MAELVAPEDLPKFVPGTVLAQSDGLGWSGVSLRSYAYRGQDVEVPAMRDFMLVRYQTGVTPMERRFDGKWTRTVCGPGAVSLLTRAQVSHWHWTEDVNVTHVYLSQRLVADLADEITGRRIEDIALADILRTDDPVLNTAVDAIASEAHETSVGSDLYVAAVARQLVIHLLRKYANVTLKAEQPAGEFSRSQRRRLEDFVDANLHRPLTLEELARQVNMTTRTFSRYFRRSFGMQPYAYVTERRLDRARRLLGSTGRRIKEIAPLCGFSDQAHLTRRFSKRFGYAPAAFRARTPDTQP